MRENDSSYSIPTVLPQFEPDESQTDPSGVSLWSLSRRSLQSLTTP